MTILERGLHLLSFMEKRWNFSFKDSKKYDLLGLGFMKEEREELPPLTIEEDFDKRDQISVSFKSARPISEYLEDCTPKMVDFYYLLYKGLKEKLPDFFEVAYKYVIELKFDRESTFAEVHVQTSQIKVLIDEPIKIEHKIGAKVPENYGWPKSYSIIIKNIKDIEKFIEIISDNVLG